MTMHDQDPRDVLDAHALQDARDDSDPGPSIHAAGRAYDWTDGQHEEWPDEYEYPDGGLAGYVPPSWRDRYDTEDEYRDER